MKKKRCERKSNRNHSDNNKKELNKVKQKREKFIEAADKRHI